MAGNILGIDIGTGNIKIYNQADHMILVERNMIALQRKELFAYGNSAYEMFEKAPDSIKISYPLQEGVIADIHNMQTILHNFVMDLNHGRMNASDICICVPTDVTDVQKRAFFDLIYDSEIKAKKIIVVEKAIADALGMGVDVKNSQGVMVVDIGFATTEVSVLSLGGLVLSKIIKTGGNRFDELIQNAVKREYNLLIGVKTAERVRMLLNDLLESDENALIFGRDIVTGLPMDREISPEFAQDCLQDCFKTMCGQIKMILDRTPPELAADIRKRGICLTGGASLSANFAKLLSERTGVDIYMTERAAETAVIGLAKVITDETCRSMAYTIQGMD